MELISNVILNMQAPAYATVYSPQGQTLARSIRATLMDGSTPWEIPAGALAVIRYSKPDGTVGFYDTLENGDLAYSFSGNIITFGLATQALTVPGTVYMQIDFYAEENVKLSTFTFRLEVQANVFPDEEIISDDYINVLTGKLSEAAEIFQQIAAAYGAPRTAATAAAMTDHSLIYVYTGSETGYVAGNWYYWDGTAWTSGGVYNSVAISTDKTLSIADMAADAKATGDAISDVRNTFSGLMYPYATEFTGTTLSSITTGGVYIISNSVWQNITDSPISIPSFGGCILIVEKNGYSNPYRRQTFRYKDQILVRYTENSGTNWSDWKEIYYKDNLGTILDFPIYTQVADNRHLSEYSSVGVYLITSGTNATLVDSPCVITGYGAAMFTIRNSYNTNFRRQVFMISDKTFIRKTTDAGSTWSNWIRLVNDLELNDIDGEVKTIKSELTGKYAPVFHTPSYLDLTTGIENFTDSRAAYRYTSGYIPSITGELIVISNNSSQIAASFYDINKNFVGYQDWSSSFVKNIGNGYARISVRNSDGTLPASVDVSVSFGQFDDAVIPSSLKDFVETIETERDDNSISFSIMTDNHYNASNAAKTLVVMDDMIKFASFGAADMGAHLGDVHNGQSITIANMCKDLTDLAKRFYKQRAFCTMLKGNHDDGTWSVTTSLDIITDSVWRNRCMSDYGMVNNYFYNPADPTGNYFYKDFDKYKIRVICLDTLDVPHILSGGTLKYKQTVYGMQETQLKWLAQQALILSKENDSDWAIVFLTHVPLKSDGGDGQGLKNYDVFKTIVNGFIAGASGTATSSTIDFEASVTYDFTEQGAGEVICNFHGHTHSDVYDNTSNSFPLIGFLNTANANAYFDVALINRTEKTIKTKRYNRTGYDRSWTYGT